jgi:hypothetical protein
MVTELDPQVSIILIDARKKALSKPTATFHQFIE